MSTDSTTPRMPDLDKDEIKDIDKRLSDIGFGKNPEHKRLETCIPFLIGLHINILDEHFQIKFKMSDTVTVSSNSF